MTENTNTLSDDLATGIDEFSKLKARIGFVSLKDGIPNTWVLLPRLLLERPCGEGAVPPNLLDEWENADQSKRASIAHKYSKGGYGIDAYIIQLRMQIAYGVYLEAGLHDRITETLPNGQITACAQIFDLAWHTFGQDPAADVKVKGCILYLLHGKQDVIEIPHNTMEGLKELAAGLAYPLMFERHETSLIQTNTVHGTGGATFETLNSWKPIDLPTEGLPFVHSWDGTNSLEELLSPLLRTNLAIRFPNLTDPPCSGFIVPFFNLPVFVVVRYQCNKELPKPPSFNELRYFKLRGRASFEDANRKGSFVPKWVDAYFQISAVVNLDNDDVRLYGPDTCPLVEFSPPDREDAGQRRDNGQWNVSQRETKFLLWYRRPVLKDGEGYKLPKVDAPEFMSAEEFDRQNYIPGSYLPFPDEDEPDDDVDSRDWCGRSEGPAWSGSPPPPAGDGGSPAGDGGSPAGDGGSPAGDGGE